MRFTLTVIFSAIVFSGRLLAAEPAAPINSTPSSKTTATPITKVASFLLTNAASTNLPLPAGLISSVSVSNLFVVFQEPRVGESQFPADKPIPFAFGTMNTQSYDIFILREDYGYRIRAQSAEGKPLKLTKSGSRYGRQFDQATILDKGMLDLSSKRRNPFLSIAVPQPPYYFEREFPPPQQLFEMPKSGSYVLWVEVQVFNRPRLQSTTNIYGVRFPAVRIDVIK